MLDPKKQRYSPSPGVSAGCQSYRVRDRIAGYCSHRAGTGKVSPSWGLDAFGAWAACAAYSLASASCSAAAAGAAAPAPHTSPPPPGAAALAPAGCGTMRGSCQRKSIVSIVRSFILHRERH